MADPTVTPPSTYSFNVVITPINSEYVLLIAQSGSLPPVVVNINQPQILLDAFGKLAIEGLSTLTKLPTFGWVPGTWKISVEHVEEPPQ